MSVLRRIAIKRISRNRMTEVRGMDTNLMGSPRLNPEFDEGNRALLAKDRPVRDRALAVRNIDRHPLRIPRLASDRRLKAPRLRLRRPVKHRQVSLFHLTVRLKGLAQLQVGALGLGEDHHAAGIRIKTMNDPRTLPAADGRQGGAMFDQGARKRARLMAR